MDATARTSAGVTPNRRGARSREAVLDAAERLMAEQGYEAASVAALVEEAGIPASSIYHYFGSKEGVLLAVMERGAERFFAEVPDLDRRVARSGSTWARWSTSWRRPSAATRTSCASWW
jgi:AcrR family transcriptional regulator